MKYIKLFEERLRDYEILSSPDSDLLISELRKEIERDDYDIEYIIDLVTYGHFDIDVLWEEHYEQWSFLMRASYLNKVDIVKALLDGGANPNLQNEFGDTALTGAAENGNTQAVQELLKHPDIDPNLKTEWWGWTPLSIAAEHGKTPAVQELLKHPDIDPNLQDNKGQTALMIAAEHGKTPAVQELLKHPDIDLNLQDNKGQTALMVATIYGRTEAVQELLSHPDIDPNLQNENDDTALMEATKLERTEAVQELLSHPAIDITIINKKGQTAWDLAKPQIREQFPELKSYL